MKRYLGVSLIEVILVLSIASFMLVLGIRQYLSYRLDADVALIKSNVDTLFAAMSSYYQANCGGENGTLSPYNTTTPPDFNAARTINIMTELIDGGYLNANQIVPVSLVPGNTDVATRLTTGYRVQFKPKRVDRPAPAVSSGQGDNVNYTWPLDPATGSPVSTGFIIVWTPEIMVQLNNPARSASIALMTRATSCIATDWSNPMAACDVDDAPALYFTHQVSFANHAGAGSDYWIMNPVLSQMRDQEGSYNPMVVLSTGFNNQYSYCGS